MHRRLTGPASPALSHSFTSLAQARDEHGRCVHPYADNIANGNLTSTGAADIEPWAGGPVDRPRGVGRCYARIVTVQGADLAMSPWLSVTCIVKVKLPVAVGVPVKALS